MYQIRRACALVSQGVKMVIPPNWNPSKNGCCDENVPRTWSAQKFHEWKIEKLHDIHEQHIGTRGPNTYKKMYGKLRQHLCYYHGWDYYDIPETRRKPESKLKRKKKSVAKSQSKKPKKSH